MIASLSISLVLMGIISSVVELVFSAGLYVLFLQMDIYLIKTSIMRMKTRTPGEEEDLRVTAVKDKIKSMTAQEKDKRQVYAIRTGCQVHFSSCGCNYSGGYGKFDHYQLDNKQPTTVHAWWPLNH